MAIIETTQTVSVLFPNMEGTIVREALPGTSYHGDVTNFRKTHVTGPDTISYEYDDGVVNLEREQINQDRGVIPTSMGARLALRPFPGPVTNRTDLLWTDAAENVLDPGLLFGADDSLLEGINDEQLELAHDLGAIAGTADEAAYKNWLQKIAEQLDKKIPQGAIVEAFVQSIAWGGLGIAIKNRNKAPLVAAMQGLLLAATGNTLSSVVSHRMASHGSVIFTPNTTNALRFSNSLISGSKPDSFAAMHRVHHKYADTPSDPHSPLYQGRWNIFFGIKDIGQEFIANNPKLLEAEQDNPNTRHLPFENPVVLTLGIAGTHWLLGEILKLPVKYRAYSAAIHAAGLYMIRGAFTGDSHPNGAPKDFNFSPLTSVVMGGETDHARHHAEPYNPIHATVDPGYGLIWLPEKVGLASIPAKERLSQPRK